MKGKITPARTTAHERVRFHLNGRSVALDRRIHAARGDLADLALAGTLFSAHYARAVPLTCVAPGAPLLSGDSANAEAVSELLRGETFHALDVTTDWAWGFCGHDGYVGYVRRDALDTRVLILSGELLTSAVYEAVQTGVDGYLTKDADRREIGQAIVTIARGGTVLAPAPIR